MKILYIEPFEAGSHAAFTRALTTGVEADWTVLTLPGRHWKWRARGSAAWFALAHADALAQPFDLLVASAYLPLADLVALAPGLSRVPKLLYFHENQLAFPVRDEWTGARDHHYGFTQLISALAADCCAFNSRWNRDSFLAEGRALLRRMPDARPPGWIDAIEARSVVLPLPMALPEADAVDFGDGPPDQRRLGPIIAWNHRWEHDKAPERFFAALDTLQQRGVPFRVIVCGQRFKKAPECFEQGRQRLGDRVVHWGYAESRDAYLELLARSHVAVSTAIHEFFGVSMLEAAHMGARPVLPDRLSYPELFPPEHLYDTDEALVDTLERLCRGFVEGTLELRADRRHLTAPFGPQTLSQYEALFARLAAQPST